ncbi:MAG: hypothetical protein PHQ64_04285 [Bacilli bacterium]|nr:hypothetical protein [Bacilli bacterium]
MERIYRGCKEKGLKVMKPKLVNHDKPYVYATTDKIEAIIYSVKGGNFNYTNIYGYDGNKRCLIERKKNELENIYNTSGRYYILSPDSFFRHDEIGVGNNEYISESSVKVLEEIEVPNVWELLKEKEKNQEIKIYRYPTRPDSYPADDSDLIECATIIYLQTDEFDKPFDFLLKYHPELEFKINAKKEEIKNMSKLEIEKTIKYFN